MALPTPRTPEDLALTVHEIRALGVPPGAVAETFQALLEACRAGVLRNEKTALANYVRAMGRSDSGMAPAIR